MPLVTGESSRNLIFDPPCSGGRDSRVRVKLFNRGRPLSRFVLAAILLVAIQLRFQQLNVVTSPMGNEYVERGPRTCHVCSFIVERFQEWSQPSRLFRRGIFLVELLRNKHTTQLKGEG